MRFFFYGTLLDRDITALVLGRRLPPAAFLAATLPGYSRYAARGVTYPALIRDVGGKVEGAIVGGLSPRDVERLAAYEGPGYRVAALKVEVAGVVAVASVFEPVEKSLRPTSGSWDLTTWQRRHKKAFVERVGPIFSALPPYSRR
jgi:hypothetical protein